MRAQEAVDLVENVRCVDAGPEPDGPYSGDDELELTNRLRKLYLE